MTLSHRPFSLAAAAELVSPPALNLPLVARSRDTGRLSTIGALRQWRRELAAGARTIHTRDPLWRAACYEAAAADSQRDGMHEAADSDRRAAAAMIVAATAGVAA